MGRYDVTTLQIPLSGPERDALERIRIRLGARSLAHATRLLIERCDASADEVSPPAPPAPRTPAKPDASLHLGPRSVAPGALLKRR